MAQTGWGFKGGEGMVRKVEIRKGCEGGLSGTH